MIRNILTAGVAVAAMTLAAPTLAKPGEGGGPSQTGINSRVNSQGSVNAAPRAIERSSPNSALHTTTTTSPTTRATNSQGLQHANPRAISRANANSALAPNAVAPAALPGLTTGLTVNNSAGVSLGTVSQIVTDSSGNIRLVIVTNSSTGQTYRLAPTTLSISGGVVTTTSM
jgi:hypothetical protein